MKVKVLKNSFQNITHFLMALLCCVSLSGCVGTVEEGLPPQENYTDPKLGSFTFQGIIKATAIAHDKIEVEYFPSLGTVNYTYFLYVNEGTPITLTNDNVREGTSGNYVYTIKNLNINTQYKLKIRAKGLDGSMSAGENEVVVKTFDNKVANFDGIVSVQKKIGSAHDTVIVSWVAPQYVGDVFTSPVDPAYFEIKYISENGGVSNINNDGYGGLDKVSKNVPEGLNATSSTVPHSKEITGLTPNTRYYFQVRAVHYNYKNYPDFVDRELNTKFVSIKTDPLNGLVDFDKNSIILKNAPAKAALNSVEVFWEPAEGTFTKYRIFARKYTDILDPTLDDKLTDEELIALTDDDRYTDVDATNSSVTISGLDSYSWYQFLVAVCINDLCEIDAANPANNAVKSVMAAIRTEPTLASFSGINRIDHPDSADDLTKIKLHWDAPAVSVGWADSMELFCLDPDDYTNYVKFPTSDGIQISGSSIANCDGLYYDQELLTSSTWVDVKGVNVVNSVTDPDDARYCFAMAPAILEEDETKTLDPSNWIVRCITPEIKTPNIDEFPGIAGNCSVDQNSIVVNWVEPTDGIYNKYKMFLYKHQGGGNGFDFSKAINLETGYTSSGLLEDTVLTMQVDDLRPGQKYQVGVLAIAYDDKGTPSTTDDIVAYSELNNGIVDCDIPMPTATFDEWTRLFAIGPKVDGKVPKDAPYNKYKDEAMVYEALTVDGIPYETEVNATGNPVDTSYELPPGNYATGSEPTAFNQAIDGAFNEEGYTASKEGIVSLAWKDVSLDFLGTEFTSEQDLSSRTGRTYGYKVYRSDNNRLSWIDLTSESGLIHAGDFSYLVRTNATPTTQRMAFFTDYSVKYSQSADYVDRARIVWYKIVPYFEGKPLNYLDQDSNKPSFMAKVTIPPANMALVHRKVANRSQCMEMGKPIDKDNNYRCDYNGLGSVKKGIPWQVSQTVFDQEGDLLVDRFELGCSFTRGEKIADPTLGNSFFGQGDDSNNISDSKLKNFHGYSRDQTKSEGGRFKGCVSGFNGWAFSGLASNKEIPGTFVADYKNVLYGDCVGAWTALTVPMSECADPNRFQTASINYPGMLDSDTTQPYDCSANVDDTLPQVLYGGTGKGYLDSDVRRNWVIQAEHLAVLYNAGESQRAGIVNSPGPSGSILNGVDLRFSFHQSCMVNIASIGAAEDDSPWSSRWVAANQLHMVKNSTGVDIYRGTVANLHANTQVYNTTNYRAPSGGLVDANRIENNTPLTRVFASNSAKLPPLVGFRNTDAAKICEAFSVQTGVSASSGSWVATAAPKKKRLLRRKEFITSAALPETFDDTTATLLENNEEAENHLCNSSSVVNESQTLETGVEYHNTYTKSKDPSVISNQKLVTGSGRTSLSSSADSMACQSRYGIQDLVGNVSEQSSEIVYCDYSLDKFYYGKYSGNPVTGLGTGDKAESLRLDLPRDATLQILDNAPITWESTGETKTGYKYWTYIDPNSGYCSMVDTDKDSPEDSNRFREPAGTFKDVFDYNGSLNTTMVEVAKPYDQIGINDARNGDGFFWNLGQNHLSPQLSNGNTLSLNYTSGSTTTTAIGPYFSPVMGLPLKCDLESCNAQSSDNKNFSTSFFATERSGAGNVASNFPVRSSDIRTTGIGEFSYTNNQHTHQETLNPNSQDSNTSVIMGFTVKTDGSIETDVRSIPSLYAEYGDNYVLSLVYANWKIERGSALYFSSGGSASSNYNGRYTMNNYSDGGGATVWNTNNEEMGIRCAVKINTDE